MHDKAWGKGGSRRSSPIGIPKTPANTVKVGESK